MHHRVTRRTALSLALCALLLGCGGDGPTAPETVAPPVDPLALLGPGIHPVLVVREATATHASVALELRRKEVVSAVASYQGELTYDPARMKLAAAEIPQGVMGAWFEVEPGRIRFAGARLEGMIDGPVISLSFDLIAPGVDAGAFRLALDELRAAGAFADLKPSLVLPERMTFLTPAAD